MTNVQQVSRKARKMHIITKQTITLPLMLCDVVRRVYVRYHAET